MSRCRLAVVFLAVAASAQSAAAGILFNRHPKPNPSERVPVLLVTLRTEREDRKREAAVEELARYDAGTFPEIVPALVDLSQQDRSAGVRLEALKALTHLRPVNAQAGWALEQAANNDANLRVRLQARTLLWEYHLSGYHGGGKGEPPVVPGSVTTREPPLAPPLPPPVRPSPTSPPSAVKPSVETPPPPLADPVIDPSIARPLPAGPAQPTPPKPVPPNPPAGSGPELSRPE
jgi:hypothetical protein